MNKEFIFKIFPVFLLLIIAPCCEAQVPADSTAADSAMLKFIEQQVQSNEPAPQQVRSSISSNPDIGVVGDFGASWTSRGKRNLELYLNETEVSFQAAVDPYARADFFVSFGRDPVTRKYGVEVEEGYLSTLSLPARLQLKVGKFKQALGRVNTVHAHALPFIDLPDAFVNYFGEEGLNDEGVSLSWLLPTKKVYQELILQVTSGFNESPVFNRGNTNRLLYLGHLKNFFYTR